MSDPSIRCFAAVEVAAPGVRRALELFQFNLKRAFGPRDPVRWVPAHQFHFTLKFFGEIEPDAARRAADGLARVAAQTPPFTLEVAGLGTFPGAGRPPSVIWAGLGQGKAELVALAGRVEEAMALIGFPREGRTFKPHLTLGRVREGARVVPAVTEALKSSQSYGAWRVERLVLMKSDLLPTGPRYSVLHEALLQA